MSLLSALLWLVFWVGGVRVVLADQRIRRDPPRLAPDYSARRRIRDLEAEGAVPLSARARFLQTHASEQSSSAAQLDPPGEGDEKQLIKKKMVMEAESLGLSNTDDYAEAVVQEAEKEQEDKDAGELTDAAVQRAEIELAGMFSGVISAVMSNVLHERPELFPGGLQANEEL